jgi:nitrite reductase (NO-forming)
MAISFRPPPEPKEAVKPDFVPVHEALPAPEAPAPVEVPREPTAVRGILAAIGVTGMIAVLALGVVTYADQLSARKLTPAPSAVTAVAPASAVAASSSSAPNAPVNGSVEVTASEFKFAPNKLELAGPGELSVTLLNKGAVEHDITVDGVGAVKANAGATAKGVLKFDKAGTYTFFCSIPGHKEAGMVGQIVVGGGAAAAAPAVQPAPATGAMAGMPGMVGMPMAPAAPAPQVKPADPNAKPLPAPKIAPPLNRTTPANVKIDVETKEVTAKLADGQDYTFWTFGGTVPGPMFRVMQGDTVELTMRNNETSIVTHSIDLHAVTGPGGGAKVMQVPPGGDAVFKFQALNPGVYVYHCATPMVAHHISQGMYGLIVVEPPGGLPKVDREFYVMEGDLYLQGNRAQEGHRETSIDKLIAETPDYVVFNGGVGQLIGDNALKARVGETLRIFFGVGGPNVTSSFHVIGEIFDRVYPEGATTPNTNVQTTMVPAGGATMVEFKAEVPGTYTLVDHSLSRLEKGAAGQLVVEGPENPAIFQTIKAGQGGGGGH